MEVMKNTQTGSASHPDGPMLQQWVQKGLLDLFEGRGILGVDRYIQALAPLHAPLAPLRSKISSEWKQYQVLLDTVQEDAESGKRKFVFKRPIRKIESRKAISGARKELRRIAEDLPLSEQIVGAHLAFKHYKAAAIASLDALVTAYKWISSVLPKDTTLLGQSENAKKLLFHLAMTQYGFRHGNADIIEHRNLQQEIGACAYALADEKIKREDAVRLLSTTVDAIEWSLIPMQIDPAWIRVNTEATEAFGKEWSRTFGPATSFLRQAT